MGSRTSLLNTPLIMITKVTSNGSLVSLASLAPQHPSHARSLRVILNLVGSVIDADVVGVLEKAFELL